MGTWALYFEVLFGMIGSLGHNFTTPHTLNSHSSIRENQK